jgi:RND family efflux transporter MFP subunit
MDCVRTLNPRAIAWCAAALALAACSKSAAPPPVLPRPQVLVMQVIQRDAAATGELVGEVSAFREVPLRAQVTGIVQEIRFKPGQAVREHQVLFVIDPRPYQASLAQAQGAVADSEATLARARQDVARYEPLLPDNAIPRATYDAAVATEKSAQAALAQHRALADLAQIDIRNTQVRSPINGQIGLYQAEIGSLVSSGQTVLATVSTLDPVYVNFSITEADYVRFVRGNESAEAAWKQAKTSPFAILLPDGTSYEHRGTFDFVDRAVNTTTGTLAVRATFPNPDNLLRPGMNVRVHLTYGSVANALLVPQTAVTEILGREFVTVIDAADTAEQRPVTLGDRIGPLWIVKSGLKVGERVVVSGSQKTPSGTVVSPTVITESQLDSSPASANGGPDPSAP